MPSPAGEMPKTQASSPLEKVGLVPSGFGPRSRTSSSMGTVMAGFEKVKVTAAFSCMRRQGTKAAPISGS